MKNISLSQGQYKIAIHQPNYMPWLGYFYKIAICDVFVFHDDVQFTKKGFTKRVQIRENQTSTKKRYLTIPLQKHSDYAKISELRINHNENWQKKHLNLIKNSYRNAPYYDNIFTLFNIWIEESTKFEFLADWNIFLIEETSKHLGFKTKFERSSNFEFLLKNNDYNLALIKKLDGSKYISGNGAQKYQNEKEFNDLNIQLSYTKQGILNWQKKIKENHKNYIQGLSIIEELMWNSDQINNQAFTNLEINQ